MERKEIVDIAKGIGIILVVVGHSGFQYSPFISLFHMAIFFAIAGYCFNMKHAENFKSVIIYSTKRIKSLYVPYIAFNIIFILCNNLFISMNVYTTDANLLGVSNIERIATNFTYKDGLKEIIKVLLFSGGTQLSGAFWFFKALFCLSIIFVSSRYVINKINNKTGKIIVEIILLIIFVTLGRISYIKNIYIWNIGTAFSMYFIMLFGYYFNKYKDKIKKIDGRIIIISSFVILCVLYNLGEISVVMNQYPNIVFFLIASVCGVLLTYYLANYLKNIKIVKDILCYLGKNSIVIMCFHFLAFKLVNYIHVLIYNQPKEYIAAFPVLADNYAWWIVYTIVGILVPLGLKVIYDLIKKNVISKGVRNGK